jgi:hypothetical protein
MPPPPGGPTHPQVPAEPDPDDDVSVGLDDVLLDEVFMPEFPPPIELSAAELIFCDVSLELPGAGVPSVVAE